MGGLCSIGLSPADREARARSKQIEKQSKKAFNKDAQKIKLLLLGAGESGKSTLFKQMKILYGVGDKKGFTETERKEMTAVVRQNILFNFKQLLFSPILGLASEEIESKLSVDAQDAALEVLKTQIRTTNVISESLGTSLQLLWKDDKVQEAWRNRGQLQVQDALEFYMEKENFERILSESYIPSDQDILRSRVRTSGIVEEEFVMNGTKFVMVDVGGQRNERRKWIHAFENVDCVIFVAAISEYNQVLYEDNSVNRQEESLELFKSVANEEVFRDNGLVLFLNKCDLFKQKLLTIPFRLDAPTEKRNLEYVGPVLDMLRSENISDEEFEKTPEFQEIYQQTLLYTENLYRKQVPSGKQVFIKVTCATDTQQVEHIMKACQEVFLRKSLEKGGFR